MVTVTHVNTVLNGPPGTYLIGLSDIITWQSAAGLRAYTVSAEGGVLALDPAQGMAIIGQADLANSSTSLSAPTTLTFAMVNKTPSLVVAGQFHRTMEVFPLEADGSIGTPFALIMTGNGTVRGAITALETIEIGGKTAFYMAMRQSEGIALWQMSNADRATNIPQTEAARDFPAGDILAMTQVSLGGQPHLLALSSGSGALTAFRVETSGLLTQTHRIDAWDGLSLATGTVLEVVHQAGQAYALVGGFGSNSLAVVRLDAQGRMLVVDQVIDDLDTRFAGISELAVLEQNGHVFIAAAGSDGGITIMQLLPGGRLSHLTTIENTSAMALQHAGGLSLVWSGTALELFAVGLNPASEQGSGITHLRLDLGLLGEVVTLAAGQNHLGTDGRDIIKAGAGGVRIEGGKGDDVLIDGPGADTLVGGPGADVFVFLPDGQTDTILDFERGIDRLDLSALGRFYTVDAIGFVTRDWGAEITIGQDKIIIRTADGKPLKLSELDIRDLRDLTHVAVNPVTEEPHEPPPPVVSPGTPVTPQPQPDPDPDLPDPDPEIPSSGGVVKPVPPGPPDRILTGTAGTDLLNAATAHEGLDQLTGQLYRLYRATLGREPDLGGMLNWLGLINSGTMTLEATVRNFVESTEFTKFYGGLDNTGFVTLLYRNVLGRAPDEGGLANWVGQLGSGNLNRQQVVLGFSESEEFRKQTATSSLAFSTEALQMELTPDVFRLYRATLGREPDEAGLKNWTLELVKGMSFSSVISGFVTSAEFQKVYGATSDEDFVTLLYRNVLGREPEQRGYLNWLNAIKTKTLTREAVVEEFTQSPEFVRKSAPLLKVWMLGQGMDDQLDGGAGKNTLFGGMMADHFIFSSSNRSENTLIGLEPWDMLSFYGFGYTKTADLGAHLSQQGNDALFQDRGVTIRFADTTVAEVLGAELYF